MGSWNYDPTTDRGKVRLLISDTDDTNPDRHIFFDEEIDAFLAMAGGSIFKASADALRALAANEALVLKVIKNLDLETDGAKTADALRLAAKDLDTRAVEVDSSETGFAIAEMIQTPAQWRESLEKQALKQLI